LTLVDIKILQDGLEGSMSTLRRQDASDDEDQSGHEDEFFSDSDSSVAGDEGKIVTHYTQQSILIYFTSII